MITVPLSSPVNIVDMQKELILDHTRYWNTEAIPTAPITKRNVPRLKVLWPISNWRQITDSAILIEK